jgi:uncharacterized protein YjdB
MKLGNLYLRVKNIGKNVKETGLKGAVLMLFILLFAAPSIAQTCNCSWTYKVPITITNLGASTLTNYQVSITLNTSALVSAAKMQASGNDIRFTDASCTNLPYWIESGMNTASTVIWINVNNIAPSTTTTNYLYYGNAGASAASDGNATFLLFDDFNGVTLDLAKWTFYQTGGGSTVVSGGTISFNGGTEATIVSNSSFAFPYVSEMKVNSESGNWPNISQIDNASFNGVGLVAGGPNQFLGQCTPSCAAYQHNWNNSTALGSVAGTWSIRRLASGSTTGTWPGGSMTFTYGIPSGNQRTALGRLCLGGGTLVVDWARARKFDASGTTQSVGAEGANACISFNGGSPQNLVVCQNSVSNNINSLLTATDNTGLTFTWTVTSVPVHGTLAGFPTTAASGVSITPSGLSYSPYSGYSGTDAFTIQVSDGTNTASTTINVTVNPTPAAIGGSLAVCMGSTTTLSNTYGGGTWTSGTPGTATVNPVSGLVTPVAPGSTTITYTMPCGSFVTAVVNVNPLPSAIGGGPMNVCVGSTTTLTDAGGTWSSSNTGQATVSVGGVVTGVSAGTPIITYTLPTGCFVTQPVTVNPLPAAISGTLAVCSGLTTTLNDASPLGSWTSASPAVATIGVGTGIVNAVGVGPATSVITYTLPTGCTANATVTVNPNPNPIGGTTNVCTGLTTTLNATPALGTWSSSDITMATVGSSSGIVSGVAAGVPTITYMLGTGCISTTPVTVNQTPVAITGTTNVCIGSTTTLSDFTAGGTWTSSNPVFASVGAGTGIVTGLANGTLNIVYTMPSGCNTSTAFTVNPLPGLVSGTPNVCVGLTSTLSAAGGGTWTSSNPTFATVGLGTGTVTGVSAGTLNITYTLSTGCYSVIPFTVNPTPAAITGSSTVCEGSTTTFADATTGGTWTSAAPGTASVGALTGIVTGGTAGVTNIIYTLPAGCTATKAITVNPTPLAISGASAVCVGLTTVLSDGTLGGSWSSSDVTKATVVGGTVSGIAAGTVSITYTLPAGCTAIQPMTVNPTPVAITGTTVVCANSTTALSDATPGGTWSSSNNLVATVGTSGIVSGVAAGTVNIIYTLAAGCTATAPVTVNAVPNISSFSSPTSTSPCVGSNGVVTVTSASLGAGTFTVTYNLSGANTSTGNTATLVMGGGGTGTFTMPSAVLPNAGATTVTITMLTNALACTSNLISSNTASFAVNALPVAYAVLGTGSYCAGGTGVHVFLATSDGGINYQLFLGASPVGLPVAGTFTTLDMGAQTTAGTYTVVGTNTTTLCTSNMSGSATITINPLPTVFAVTGGGSYCAGGSGVLIGLFGSTSGINYQLYNGPTAVGSPVPGTGGALSFGLQTAGGIYTVIATNATTGCSANMSGSATITVNPLPAAITGTASVCVGLTTTLADATAGGTWSSVNTAVATIGTGSGVATGVTAGTSVISYTLPTGCAITTTLTVNPNPSAIAGAGAVCTGATLNLTSPTGGGTWTSSNIGEATVGSSTGVVTGVAAGTPTITYTLPTGCIATAPITVNTTPVAITGTPTVCPGSTTTLSDATIGGSWTSSNIALVTVGLGTGIVTGVASGTVTITYTVSGCTATTPVTVNPNPGAITGTTNVCTGSTVTLSSSSPGGTWASSNIGLATVGTSGVVSGVAAGTLTISYTLPTGCFATTSFTVNQTPVAITGVNNVCVGLTTTLSDATLGGSWSSSNTLLATVGTSGIVTGVAAGSPNITYTTTGSCTAIMPITVNPLPASITGASGVCIGSSTTLGDATTGGTWTSSNVVMATVGSSSGVVNGLSIGALTITYTLPTGCIATKPVTVNPLPASITGSSSVCVASSTTLSDASSGGTWSSSNPGVASVIGGTGVVTGVSAGTLTITYTLPTGCIATTPMTVNPTPVAITGSSTVCTGLTTTLSDATAGGSWSSSDLTKASVGAGTGVVTGVAVGTLNIIYTLPAGCTATFPMTVNLQPAAITGSSTVCTSLTTTLSDATIGGSWTSSDPTIATVGTGTGIVTGVAAGTLNITYTMPGGCTSVFPMTVNQNPAAITGTFNVCVGSTRTLADASIGGTWTSSNPALATVGSGTGLVTGISAGTVTITYTLPGGCTAVTPFTVNPLPALITGVNVVCVNATITLADATVGGTWTTSNNLLATVGTSGIVTGVAAGAPVISYTLPTGCFATMPITVNPLPTLFTITGGGAYCSGGVGLSVGLSGSTIGINYQLMRGVTSVGSPMAGTGSSLDFGLQTLAGTYTVVATNPITGCFVTMTGGALITVNTLPTVFNVTGGGSYCSGGAGVTISLSGSTIGVNYQLYLSGIPIGSPVAGTNLGISFGSQTAAGVYTVVATNALTLCTSNMTGSATVVINPLPTVFTVSGGGAYCTGGAGVHIFLSNSTVGVSYALIRTGPLTVTTLPGTGGALDFGFQTVASTYTVTATNSVTGCVNTMAGSATIVTNPVPSTFSVTGGGAFCAGGTGVAVGLSSSTTGINYQLYIGGSAVGSPVAGTNLAISFGLQTAPGTYTVVATNPTTTCTSNMTGSAVVTINPLPAIFTVTGGGGFCTGGAGVNIFLSGSVVGVNYQLFRGVTALSTVAGTGSSLAFGLQTVAGTYTVVATTVATGCVNTMAGSAAITVNPLPTLYTVTGGGAFCAGTSGVHVGLSSSDPGINYQLYLGAVPIGSPLAGTGAALDFGFVVAAGTYTVVATNTTTLCTSTMTGNAIVTINPAPLTFSITGGGSYCAGGLGVHIGLSSSTGGVTYQLYNGLLAVGAPVAGAGVPLDFGFVTAAGTYTIVATITATGCTATMAGTATVVINPLPPLNTVTGGGAYCAGGTGVHIGLNGSVTGVSYQLYNGPLLSGVSMAGTGSPLDFGFRTTAGTYTVVATNTTTGCTNTMTGSVVITVNPLPTIYSVTGGGGYCAGGSGMHVGLSNSTAGVSYQLNLAGSPIGAPIAGTGSALDFGFQTAAGIYTVTATNTTTSCTSNMAGSVSVFVFPLPSVYTVTGGGNYCIGGTGLHVGLSSSTLGINYQLFIGGSPLGSPIVGTNLALDLGLQTAAGTYTVVASSPVSGCTANMTGSATIVLNPLPTAYVVTGGGSYCAGGTGVNVGLSGSNAGINYQLFVGVVAVGGPMAGTGAALNFGLQTTPGTYTIVATNATTGCISNLSSSVTVIANPLPGVFNVSGGGSFCAGGSGVNIGLDGSAAGINYQLYSGLTAVGTPVPGTGSLLDFGVFSAGGSYTVVAIDGSTGCTANMAGSATITVSPLPVIYTVTGGGSYCTGGGGLHVGLNSSDIGINYQLYKGVTMIGAPVAGTGLALDFGVFTSAGSYSVVATYAVSGCTSNMSGSVTIAVNALPIAFTVTGGGSYCAGGSGYHIGLSGSTFGVSYQLYNGLTAVGAPIAGTGSALDFGLISVVGTYTVVGTNTSTTCMRTMTGSATITINALPDVYTVTGGGSYCPAGAGVHIGLSGSNTGINYQLYRGITAIGTPVAGNDSTVDFGLQTVAGSYTVVAINATTGCSMTMAGSVSVSISPLPVVQNVTGGGTYCAGGTGVHVTLSGSQGGVNYQLYIGGVTMVGGPVAGTGLPLDLGVWVNPGNYTVVATNATTGCNRNMAGTAVIAINPVPVVFTVTGGGSYCAGDIGLHVGLSGSATGINYQLYRGLSLVGTPIAGTGFPLDFGLQTAAGVYTVVAMNATTSCTSNMASAAAIVINPLPVVYSVAGGGSYCAGGTGVDVFISGSEVGVNYQLFRGTTIVGSPVAGTGALLSLGLQTAAGTYTVVATNITTGCTRNMIGSAIVVINALPTPYVVTGGGSYCAGGTGLHVSLSGSVTGTTYQLWRGFTTVGSPVPGTGSVIDFGLQTAGGTYTVEALNTTTGCSNTMTGNAVITVNPLPTPFTVNGGGSYCSGTSGIAVGLGGSTNGVDYQLYNGSVPVGPAVSGTGIAISFGLQTLAGTYTVVATNVTTGCVNDMAGSTNVTIITTVVPEVTVSNGVGDTVCAGTSVVFSAAVVNGGSLPAYQWRVNNVIAPSTGSTYTYFPTSGDVVSVIITSSAACATPDTATDAMTVIVRDNMLPVVTVTTNPGDTVCEGTVVHFTATSSYGGTAPSYSWILNGTNVGTGTAYSYVPSNNDIIFCSMTSNYQCVSATTVLSNNVRMNVEANVDPTVTITLMSGAIVGSIIYDDTLTANVSNGGYAPTYQWSINGNLIPGATSATFIQSSLNNNDVVTCYVVNNNMCGSHSGYGTVVIRSMNVGVKPVVNAGSDIRLVPNPNKGVFTIKGTLGSNTDEEVVIEITDMLGEMVYSNKVVASKGEISEKIQLSNTLANGMYIINVRSGIENKVFHMVIEQ